MASSKNKNHDGKKSGGENPESSPSKKENESSGSQTDINTWADYESLGRSNGNHKSSMNNKTSGTLLEQKNQTTKSGKKRTGDSKNNNHIKTENYNKEKGYHKKTNHEYKAFDQNLNRGFGSKYQAPNQNYISYDQQFGWYNQGTNRNYSPDSQERYNQAPENRRYEQRNYSNPGSHQSMGGYIQNNRNYNPYDERNTSDGYGYYNQEDYGLEQDDDARIHDYSHDEGYRMDNQAGNLHKYGDAYRYQYRKNKNSFSRNGSRYGRRRKNRQNFTF